MNTEPALPKVIKAVTLNLLEPSRHKAVALERLHQDYTACAIDVMQDTQLLRFAHSMGMPYNRNLLHKMTYPHYRKKYPALSSQLIESARISAFNRRKVARSISRIPVRYDQRTFSVKKTAKGNPLISFATDGRKRVIIPIAKDGAYRRAQENISQGWKLTSVLLLRDHRRLQFILTKSFDRATERANVLGVDVGSRRLAAVTIIAGGKTLKQLYLGRDIGKKQKAYIERRARLQSKGTRKAWKALRRLRHRQRNFVTTRSWQVAHEAVNLAEKYQCLIRVENLKRLKTGRRMGNSKGRKANGVINRIPYAQFFMALDSLCVQKRIGLQRVKPRHTSQYCPRCGKACRKNRISPYKVFRCVFCGYTCDADRNASRNVANNIGERTITIVGPNMVSHVQTSPMGAAVNQPVRPHDGVIGCLQHLRFHLMEKPTAQAGGCLPSQIL